MAIGDITILSMLRTKMQWHQERQRVLAENVSNSDTPNFRPRDLVPVKFDGSNQTGGIGLALTSPGHIEASGGGAFNATKRDGYETRPAGNAVNLEDEMMKVAENQMDYQTATALYTRSLGLLKTALGRK